jgi:hypothetical protein
MLLYSQQTTFVFFGLVVVMAFSPRCAAHDVIS